MFSKFLLNWIRIFMDDLKVMSFRADSGRKLFPMNKRYAPLVGTRDGLDRDWLIHVSTLREFFKQALSFGLLLKIQKLVIASPTVRYFGWVIGVDENSLSLLPARLPFFEGINPDTITRSQLATVLGTAAYVSSCVDSFAAKAAILYNYAVQPKTQPFSLSKTAKACLVEICLDVCNSSKRYLFNPQLRCEVHTDASVFSCGALLSQIVNGRRVLLKYCSWKFSPAETRTWSSALKELSPILKVIARDFSLLVQCRDLVFFTDCLSIVHSIQKSRLSPGNTAHDRYISILLALPLKFKVMHLDASDPVLSCADNISRDPRYFMRHSNRLRRKKDNEVVPGIWRPSMMITSQDIMDELHKTDALAWPVTSKSRILEEDKDSDPLNNVRSFDQQVMEHLLPRIELKTATYKQAQDAPPLKDPPPIPSVDSSCSQASSETQSEHGVTTKSEHGVTTNSEHGVTNTKSTTWRHDNDDIAAFLEENDSDFEYDIAIDGLSGEAKYDSGSEFIPDERMSRIIRNQTELAEIAVPQIHSSSQELKQLRAEIFNAKGHGLTLSQICDAQRKCPKIGPIVRAFLDGKPSVNQQKKYLFHNHMTLMKKSATGPKIVLPLRAAVIATAALHLIIHSGQDACYTTLRKWYYAYHFRDVVNAVVSSCAACRITRWNTRMDAPAGIHFRAVRPFETLVLDFLVQKPCTHRGKTYRNILNIGCVYSRYCFCFPTVTEKALEVAKILELLLAWLPGVRTLLSDGGPGLLASRTVRDTVAKYAIDAKVQLANNETSHSVIESLNNQLRISLNANLRSVKDYSWVDCLPMANFALNSMQRTYRILEIKDGKEVARTVKTSATHIAFGFDSMANIDRLLGPTTRENPRRLEVLRKIHTGLQRHFKREAALQLKRDRRFAKRQRILPGQFVLVKRIPRNKHKSYYINNIYIVKERFFREILIQSIFGDLSIHRVYIKHVKLFKNSELLKYLPPKLRKLYGGYVDLKSGSREIPFELRSTLSDLPRTRITRAKTADKSVKLLRIPRETWKGLSDSSSDDDRRDNTDSASSSDTSESDDSTSTKTSSKSSSHDSNQDPPADGPGRHRPRKRGPGRRNAPAPTPMGVETRAMKRHARLQQMVDKECPPGGVPPFCLLPEIERRNLVKPPSEDLPDQTQVAGSPRAESTPTTHASNDTRPNGRRTQASMPLTVVPRASDKMAHITPFPRLTPKPRTISPIPTSKYDHIPYNSDGERVASRSPSPATRSPSPATRSPSPAQRSPWLVPHTPSPAPRTLAPAKGTASPQSPSLSARTPSPKSTREKLKAFLEARKQYKERDDQMALTRRVAEHFKQITPDKLSPNSDFPKRASTPEAEEPAPLTPGITRPRAARNVPPANRPKKRVQFQEPVAAPPKPPTVRVSKRANKGIPSKKYSP